VQAVVLIVIFNSVSRPQSVTAEPFILLIFLLLLHNNLHIARHSSVRRDF